MKHLYTFFVTLMTFGITVAQTNITFDESWVVNGESWTIKQDEGSTVTIEEADSNKYLQVVYEATGQEWQNAQIKPQYSMGHTYITVEAGNTLQFDVWADHTGDANQGAISGMVKIEKESNSSDNYEYSFTLNGDGQWQTVTIDLGVADKNNKEPNGEDYYLIVFFNNYGTGTYLNPDTRYYDNIIFDGTALPDPNAVETYTPNAPATAPTVDSSDVISIYSDTYTSAVAEFNNNPSWGQATSVAEESLFSNSFLKYTNLNYQGTEFTATDVDAKEYLHVDYYLGKSDITSVDFYLIGGGVEVAKALSVTSKGEWVSVDIDLAWVDWSFDNSVEFNNLNFGSYVLYLKARSGQQLLGDNLVYDFSIQRPWYFSYFAIGAYFLLLVLISLVINNLYTSFYKKQQTRFIEDTQKELALKELANTKALVEAKNEQLNQRIENKNRELAISTMSMIKKNTLLGSIKDDLDKIDSISQIKSVIRSIDNNINNEDDWNFFEEAFNNADKDFLKKIKDIHPKLTPNDLRLCAYLRLNLSSKEIASLLNISSKSVEIKRYRLRKRMNLDHKTNLISYILSV